MSDRAFDHVTNLVDRGVEFFLPVEKLTAGWFAVRGGDAGSDVALIGAERSDLSPPRRGCHGLRRLWQWVTY
jgi:hypothetical protein